MSFLSEFREFAMKGNVVDLAVGVIIGGAFGKIVASLVGDVVMPAIGLLTGGIDFSGLAYTVKGLDGKGATLKYGLFVQNVVDFLIVALVIFVAIKAMNRFKKTEPPAAPPAPTPTEATLVEIRDLLKSAAVGPRN